MLASWFDNGPNLCQATKDAGAIAGLEVMRIINEPTAAAVAYGLQKGSSEQVILVFDLGGGTFDVSLLKLDDEVFEVLATSGDTHLGGQDFDNRMIDYLVGIFDKKSGLSLRSDSRALGKLKREVEKAKRSLSSQHVARIEIESLMDGIDFSETMTRAKFEELNIDLFKATLKPVQQVLEASHLQKRDIDEIVLVGGSTRIPKVVEILEEYFNGKKANSKVNPDEAVAYGAAIQGGVLRGDEGGEEEDTALGLLILDRTPMTLGIELVGEVMSALVPRHTLIPTKKTDIYTTASDNQVVVSIKIFEGESTTTRENNLLGKFDVVGIRPAPRGQPKIQVAFEIDANSILLVSAIDTETGNANSISIKNNWNRLTPEEVEKMKQREKVQDTEDRTSKERNEAREVFETFVYKLLSELPSGGRPTRASIGAKDALNSALTWISSHQTATKEEVEARRKILVEDLQGFRSSFRTEL